MKIAVITRHAITNYGSFLQAFATQKMIEKIGHDCTIIDYIRDDETYRKREYTLLKRKNAWNKYFFTRAIYILLRQPESVVVGKKFEKYRKEYLNLSNRISDKIDLHNSIYADVFMTGSDQVWGLTEDGNYDSAYFLDFVEQGSKKVAYAASFGKSDIDNYLLTDGVQLLKKYNTIAVREDSAIDILRAMNINATQVLDPTLLISSIEWNQYTKKKQRTGKYILIYQLHNDKKLNNYAKKLSKETGLPLFRVSVSLHQIVRGGRLIWAPDISEFLYYIKNAECLITDSFHGTAFAINFNVSFVEVLPNTNTGTRNQSILKLMGLTNRILIDENDLELGKRKINYSYVNRILDEKRQESYEILNRMIND